jgi:hypothetical protein
VMRWATLSVALYFMSGYGISWLLSWLTPRYIPKQNRGCRPYMRWLNDQCVPPIRRCQQSISKFRARVASMTQWSQQSISKFRATIACETTGGKDYQMKEEPDPPKRYRRSVIAIAKGSIIRTINQLLLLCMMMRSSVGIAIATNDPSFALQHMVFCMRANSDSATDH